MGLSPGFHRRVAQLVEHRSPKPRVAGSSPVSPAKAFMKFTAQQARVAISDIESQLQTYLEQSKSVLWLTSGGSAIAIQVEIMNRLHAAAPEKLSSMMIMPVDERYGVYGHENSNTSQMRAAGFKPGRATWYDVLEQNLPMSETVNRYA